MSDVKVITLNVKGINNVVKRQKILSFLKKEKCQIAFVQETHLSELEHLKLRRSWVGQVFHSSYNSKSRGVAVLIHRSLPFTLEKSLSDKEGRYVLISGYLYGELIVLGCVYAPNNYEASFLPKLLADLASFSSPHMLLGGDLNCVLSELDVSSPRLTSSSKSNSLREFLKDLDLFDAWRVLHPLDRDYTFFSCPHQVHSRIDYFFSSRQFLGRIQDCKIGTQSLSDHAPVVIVISPPYKDPSTYHWRLSPAMLSSKRFVDFITAQCQFFFAENKAPEISPSTLWEAAKATIRGAIISYTSAQKKEALKRQLELEEALRDIETQFKRTPNRHLAKKVEAARSALNQILTQKAEAQIFYAKHRLFESGNKPGRLLARLARGRVESNIISSLLDKHGTRHFKSTELNKLMKSFYEELYSSDCVASLENRRKFLDKIHFPSLSEDQKDMLCRPITEEEVSDTIKTLQRGKAPGPDGFGPDFYKTFRKIIVGPLTDMYVDSLEKGCLPPTLNLAHISVLLKKGKPNDMCGSYRPISLISVDSKLLSKLLAKRLENLLPILINPDQTGFIQGRYSSSNVRRLLNIVHSSFQNKQKTLAISLDADKAYDRVEWPYLFDIMERFGLGGNFLKWTQTIYQAPRAIVVTNGRRSESFPVARGVRQGCPLSPLLFALALEPLAEVIRLHTEIKGVYLGDIEHKIALYADDILLFVSSPALSIPAIMNTFSEFSFVSGYKINFNKSEAMPLGCMTKSDVPNNFPFKWSNLGFTYLGIRISPTLLDLWKLNFAPILSAVKKDLERWHNLPLSMFGRISLIKMNVLPRLLYPLQMLPLYLTKKTNKDLERAVSKFIWHGKKPRLRLKVLQLSTDMGGRALPNLIFYNWACHARHLWSWLHAFKDGESCVDSWACYPFSPWSLVMCNPNNINPDVKHNPLIYNSIKVWRDIAKHFGIHGKSLLAPITQNPDFPPGNNSSVFMSWRDKHIIFLGHLFKDNILRSFQDLQDTFHIARSNFFGYLQIRHFLLSLPNFPPTISLSHNPENFLLNRKDLKGFISGFYYLLLSCSTYELPNISKKWEGDLGTEFIEDDWQEAIAAIRSAATSNRLRETQYKILHRLHITPVILHKIDRSISPLCNKCNAERGTYFHYFWDCKYISRFWTQVAKIISEVIEVEVKKDPSVFLVGLPSKVLQLPAPRYTLLEKLLISARKCILLNWIEERPPTVTQWYKEIFSILPHERLMALAKGKESLFNKIWSPFIDYLPEDLSSILLRGELSEFWSQTRPRSPS